MKCVRALSLIQLFLDANLTDVVAEELRTHLDTCTMCSREYAALRNVDCALAGEPLVDPPSALARTIARRAAARQLTARRVLLPAWLEALSLGGMTVALGASGFVGISLLTSVADLHLSPAMTAAGVAAVIATGLAIFSSSFYGAEI